MLRTRIRTAVKEAILSAPGGRSLQLWWQRKHVGQVENRWGLPEIAAKFVASNGWSVQSGPFAGMSYIRCGKGSNFVHKLLGAYESELHAVLCNSIRTDYSVVINVGCAEGYYAVGLARILPGARVFAFDLSPQARRCCKATAEANGVLDRVNIRGLCDHEQLSALLANKRSLVMSDCEGGEYELLDSTRVPALAHADILIELHDCASTRRLETFLAAFATTHVVQRIYRANRDARDYPSLNDLLPEQRRLALEEFRDADQQWAFLNSKAG